MDKNTLESLKNAREEVKRLNKLLKDQELVSKIFQYSYFVIMMLIFGFECFVLFSIPNSGPEEFFIAFLVALCWPLIILYILIRCFV